eukprot:m.53558 g.53558  ORF g.53558 m.53558 type:complete len:283 (+) comp11369_c0_seq2:348-1196(+)
MLFWLTGLVADGLSWLTPIRGPNVPYFGFGRYMGHFTAEEVDTEVDPYFFKPEEYDWVSHVEANWTVIRDELQAYLTKNNNSLIPYFGEHLMSSKKCWRALGMRLWNIEHPYTPAEFPRTMEVFSKVPNLVSLSFSQLQPNSTIKPHFGDTNANFRCHLGIKIPASLPQCGFRVGPEEQSWQEGKVLMFCDAHLHTAFNNTNETRFIVNFDVMRPKFRHQTASVCAKAIAAIMTQKVWQAMPFVKANPTLTWLTYKLLSLLMLAPVGLGLGNFTVYKMLAGE